MNDRSDFFPVMGTVEGPNKEIRDLVLGGVGTNESVSLPLANSSRSIEAIVHSIMKPQGRNELRVRLITESGLVILHLPFDDERSANVEIYDTLFNNLASSE